MQSSTHYVYSVQENGALKAFAVDGRHNAVGNINSHFSLVNLEKKKTKEEECLRLNGTNSLRESMDGGSTET